MPSQYGSGMADCGDPPAREKHPPAGAMLLYCATKSILIRMISELITTLAQARKAARITQADLAERAGLSRMAVQRTETGDVDPRFSTLQEMARVLNMELIAVPAELHAQVLALIQPQTGQTAAADRIASPVTDQDSL